MSSPTRSCAAVVLLVTLWTASHGASPCSEPPPGRDCSDLDNGTASGVCLVSPGLRHPVPVLCDAGWTVIQRCADIQPRQDFFLGWEAYKWGFGELDGEFWWGLEHLWLTTSLLDRRYELRIDLEDFENVTRHAVYQGFRVSSEADGYRLTVANYTGDAGDALTGQHSGMQFSTKDRDHDMHFHNCAESLKAAWWYRQCFESSLNGKYLMGDYSNSGRHGQGVNWNTWKGLAYSLKTVTMKIRPTKNL